MEIKINKDVQEYKESIAFGLDVRQFAFSGLALVCGAGTYLLLHGSIPPSVAGWVAIAAAVPAGMFGFFKYNELPLEKYLSAVIKTKFSPEKRIFRTTEMLEKQRAATAQKKKAPTKKKKKNTA